MVAAPAENHLATARGAAEQADGVPHSSRPKRTGWTPTRNRTVPRIGAMSRMAWGERRCPLPASRRGRRRIVLSGPSLLPPIPLSGSRDRRRRYRRLSRAPTAPAAGASCRPPDDSVVAEPVAHRVLRVSANQRLTGVLERPSRQPTARLSVQARPSDHSDIVGICLGSIWFFDRVGPGSSCTSPAGYEGPFPSPSCPVPRPWVGRRIGTGGTAHLTGAVVRYIAGRRVGA